jgi:hypothetical protein
VEASEAVLEATEQGLDLEEEEKHGKGEKRMRRAGVRE